ncbi:hypothetical protein Tco_1203433 [Tanacetum coccineum]
MESDGQCLYGKFESIQSLYMCEFESFMFHIVIGLIVLAATEFAYWAPNIESMEVNSESNPLERKDAEGPSLDESLENEEHLDVDSCDSDSLRMLTTDSVSPSSRVLQEEDVRGVESDLNRNPGNQAGGAEAREMVYALGRGETDQDTNDMEDDINA